MNLPYVSAGLTSWNTHKQVKLREIDYPLREQEPNHFTVTRTYEGPKETYAALALDTADDDFFAAKFVRQGPLADIGGGSIRYERVWATVPASWSEPESYAYTFPAFLGATAFGTPFNVTAITAGAGNFVLTTAATGISIGDSLYLSLNYVRGSKTYQHNVFCRAVAATSTVSVTIPAILFGSGAFGTVSGTIAKSTPGRAVGITQVVGSRLLHDYALSSTAALDTDLPLQQPFTPVDASGNILTGISASTYPTSAVYAAMIANGGELAAQIERRRYMGNIYVRITRLVPAQ